MNSIEKTDRLKQSPSQIILRLFAYGISAFVAFFPIGGWPAVLGAWLAVATCVILTSLQKFSQVRFLAVLVASIGAITLGIFADNWLGGFSLPAKWVGSGNYGIVVEFVTFGLISAGIVSLFRTMAIRFGPLIFVEAFVILLPVVLLFAGHRDLQFGRPRFLSDWASTNGLSIITVLTIVGVGLIFAGVATVTRENDGKRLFESILLICVLIGVGSLVYYNSPRTASVSKDPSGQSKGKQNEQENQSKGKSKKVEGTKTPPPPKGDSKGFDDETDIPPPSNSSQQKKTVAMVLLESDFQPPNGTWHFRQSVRSRFDGNRLIAPLDAEANIGIPTTFPIENMEIDTHSIEEGWSQQVSGTVHLMSQLNRPVSPVSTFELSPVQNPNPDLFKKSYAFQANVLADPTIDGFEYKLYAELTIKKAGNPNWSEDLWNSYTEFPSDDPRYKELADKIISENLDVESLPEFLRDSAMLRVLTVKRWLEKNAIYTFHPDPAVTDDPTADFLFGTRRGYCTHLSNSNVLLLRALGIPARVAIGFAVPVARAGKSATVTIQGSDAHAWTEVYFENTGWVAIEINTERIADDTQLPTPPDAETSRALAKEARKNPVDPKKDKAVEEKRAVSLSIALLRILAIVGLMYLPKIWRRLSPWFCSVNRPYKPCYRDVLDRLSEIGIYRQFGETREQFASRVSAQVPAFATMTDAHMNIKYGQEKAIRRSDWLDLRKTAITQISSVTTVPRRCIGVMNPFSWIRTS